LIKRAVLQQGMITRIVSTSSLLTPDPYLPANHDELISNLRSTVNEHGIILEAIRIRDTNLAKAAMERHLQQDFATVTRRLSRSEQEHNANDLHFPQRQFHKSRSPKKHAMRSTQSA
jgi:DNA-binding GntR family transcriptional regulator